jgi:hypothetical protein
LAERVQH